MFYGFQRFVGGSVRNSHVEDHTVDFTVLKRVDTVRNIIGDIGSLSTSMYNHPQGALPCLSRSRSERRSSSQIQPANQSRTLHDSSNPLTIIPRHRNPSNRIPTSTKWPQQSKRSTPKSGPTRSRTTSAQPVSRPPENEEGYHSQEEAHCASACL